MRILITVAASLAALAALPARAADITTLYNTGVDANHVALVGDFASDPNYQVVSNDGATPAGGQAVAFNCCYVADDAQSRWITVDSSTGADAANTTYETTFNLTGYDPTTATVSGGFAADNHGEVFLNGIDTGYHTDDFSSYTSFSLTSGFTPGVNTLDFQVANDGGPEALRVEGLTGTAGLVAGVPEPAAWALMLIGFGGVGALVRRRGRIAAAA